jgi:hypothetical protein
MDHDFIASFGDDNGGTFSIAKPGGAQTVRPLHKPFAQK